MEFVAELLIKLNLLNSRGSIVYLILVFVVLAILISGIAKKMISIIVTGAVLGVICFMMFMMKVNLVDNNGLQFEPSRVISAEGKSINYSDIEKIEVRNSGKKLAILSKDGDEIVLRVESNYSKPLKAALEKLGDTASSVVEENEK